MCEKQRDSKKKGGGTERVYAVQQHTALASIWQPCSACRQDSVNERESKEERRKKTITKGGKEDTREAQLQELD